MLTRKFTRAGGGPINDRVDHLVHDKNGMRMYDRKGRLMTGGTLWNLAQATSLAETGHWVMDVRDDTPQTVAEMPGGAW